MAASYPVIRFLARGGTTRKQRKLSEESQLRPLARKSPRDPPRMERRNGMAKRKPAAVQQKLERENFRRNMQQKDFKPQKTIDNKITIVKQKISTTNFSIRQ